MRCRGYPGFAQNPLPAQKVQSLHKKVISRKATIGRLEEVTKMESGEFLVDVDDMDTFDPLEVQRENAELKVISEEMTRLLALNESYLQSRSFEDDICMP